MAVIKSFDTIGGHIFNGVYGSETSAEKAREVIKMLRKETTNQLFYIGERNSVEVDVKKIKCELCRADLEHSLGRRL